MEWKYVWVIDKKTGEYSKEYLTLERIEWFRNNPNFRVEE